MVNGGPYYMNRQHILVYSWKMDFDFVSQVLKRFPVWVRLPCLPLSFWGGDSLSKIASVMGVPLCADDCTSNVKRITYARLRIEVDVTNPILTVIHIENANRRVFKQKAYYEGWTHLSRGWE